MYHNFLERNVPGANGCTPDTPLNCSNSLRTQNFSSSAAGQRQPIHRRKKINLSGQKRGKRRRRFLLV